MFRAHLKLIAAFLVLGIVAAAVVGMFYAWRNYLEPSRQARQEILDLEKEPPKRIDVGIGVFEEAMAHIVGLWTTPEGDTYSSTGGAWTFVDSPALPKPLQSPHPPIIIGGRGKKRTPALVAKYATEFNTPFVPEADAPEIYERIFAACTDIGRTEMPSLSAALVVCAGVNEAEVERRAAAIGREPSEIRESGLAGMPAEIVEKLHRYEAMGVSRIYLQVLDIHDLEHVDFIGSEILPLVATNV